jgi:hypothetical protein
VRYRVGESDLSTRGRWLAELRVALGEAQLLLAHLGVSATDSCQAMDLYARIEDAIHSVQRLRGHRAGASGGVANPKWVHSVP